MLKSLAELLRNPSDFFQDERRHKIVIFSLFSLLFVCVLFFMVRNVARRRNVSGDSVISPTLVAPTQTNWWVKHEPSQTPTSLIPSTITPTGGIETPAVSINCPSYASDFKPGTFGYISLFPPYENLVRSGAGKDYSAVGFIDKGDWVQLLAQPVCDSDGYVWLNVQSAAGSSNWTAGGRHTAQWIIPCPDPKKKCSKKRPTGSTLITTNPPSNDNSNNPNTCASDKLAVGLEAQVNPNDLLVVRSNPFLGSVLGRIAPLAVVRIIDGPKCAGGAIWWKVQGLQTGWAVENNLRACPKEGDCGPWNDEQLLH